MKPCTSVSAASLVSILRTALMLPMHMYEARQIWLICALILSRLSHSTPKLRAIARDRSDRDVGSRNAERSSKDVVVLTGELDDDDGFFLIHHQFVCSRPGSDLPNTVLYIANSPSGVKDLN